MSAITQARATVGYVTAARMMHRSPSPLSIVPRKEAAISSCRPQYSRHPMGQLVRRRSSTALLPVGGGSSGPVPGSVSGVKKASCEAWLPADLCEGEPFLQCIAHAAHSPLPMQVASVEEKTGHALAVACDCEGWPDQRNCVAQSGVRGALSRLERVSLKNRPTPVRNCVAAA